MSPESKNIQEEITREFSETIDFIKKNIPWGGVTIVAKQIGVSTSLWAFAKRRKSFDDCTPKESEFVTALFNYAVNHLEKKDEELKKIRENAERVKSILQPEQV